MSCVNGPGSRFRRELYSGRFFRRRRATPRRATFRSIVKHPHSYRREAIDLDPETLTSDGTSPAPPQPRRRWRNDGSSGAPRAPPEPPELGSFRVVWNGEEGRTAFIETRVKNARWMHTSVADGPDDGDGLARDHLAGRDPISDTNGSIVAAWRLGRDLLAPKPSARSRTRNPAVQKRRLIQTRNAQCLNLPRPRTLFVTGQCAQLDPYPIGQRCREHPDRIVAR